MGELRADLEEAEDGLDVGLAGGGQAEEGAVEGLWVGEGGGEEGKGEHLAMRPLLTVKGR